MTQIEVFGYIQVLKGKGLLMDQGNTGFTGNMGVSKRYLGAVNGEGPFGGGMYPADYLDQGRFTRSVLTDKGVYFSGTNIKIHII
jgi:hypothetical protein